MSDKPIGGILGPYLGPHLTLVDSDYRAPQLPGTSIYSSSEPAPIPVSEYWDWLLRQDGPVLARMAEEYNKLAASIANEHGVEPAGTAPEAQLVPEASPPPRRPGNDSQRVPRAPGRAS
jgi:hypothetical protein